MTVDTDLPQGVTRIVAPNPGALTGAGTNTWLVGQDAVVAIDPGPDDAAHVAAVLAACAGRPVTAIVLTHTHRDHAGAAPALRAATGAPTFGFGDATAGQSARMRRLMQTGLVGGEGVMEGFVPDRTLADGDSIATDCGPLAVLHTPGHMGNHLCLGLGRDWFTGDHVMGWATSLVAPPEGDMADYLASCRRLLERSPRRLFPGHGDPVAEGAARIRDLLAHRADREAAILAALGRGPARAGDLVAAVYPDLPAALRPAARLSALAHLVALVDQGRATATPWPAPDPVFARTD